jgi:hypothetical protein
MPPSSPLMQSMLDNPQLLQGLMQANPAMQQVCTRWDVGHSLHVLVDARATYPYIPVAAASAGIAFCKYLSANYSHAISLTPTCLTCFHAHHVRR